MKTRLMIAMAALALVGAACSNDDVDNWAGEIRLSSGLSVQQVGTRAATDLQSGAFDTGESVDVFIEEAISGQASTSYPQPLTYTTGGTNGLTPPAGQQPYYPTSGNGVNIYGYYPSGKVTSVAADATVDFSVATDQSTAAGYKASDLMYGVPATNPVDRTSTTVPIGFKHLLSKVTVTLKSGKGTPDLSGAKVELLNVLPATTLTTRTGAIAAAKGTATPIHVLTAASATDLSGSAVVVPQTLNREDASAGKRRFVKVTLANGGELYSQDMTAEDGAAINDIVMNAAMEYKYEITVNLTTLDISSSINPWTNGGSGKGDAVME